MTGSSTQGWSPVELGEVVTLKRGYDLPTRLRQSGDVPIVSSSGITGYHNAAKRPGPGVVTGRYGTLGEVFYVAGAYWPLNTTLYVQDFRGNDPRFIAYFLQHLNLGAWGGAAAVPGVNRNVLHGLPVLKPPISAQYKIAAILSTYDDLIENNTRRIKILEEMAQRIYQEWFVEFHYPGHEDVPLVDSALGAIPERWRVTSLREALELAYGKALRAQDRREGKNPVFGSGGIVGWHDTSLVSEPGIVVGRKGNVGSVHWSDAPFFPIDTTYYVKTSLPLRYVYFALRTLDFIDSHAAVPGLSREQAYGLPLLIPDQTTSNKFEEIVRELWGLRAALSAQSTALRAIRDLLLPRLISGQIDVEDLDIDTSGLAA